MLLFWALQWQGCQQKEDGSEKREVNRWGSLREWLVKNEQNVHGVIKNCEVIPAPDHGYTLLVLQGCKHQSQRITEATKAHSDMKKKKLKVENWSSKSKGLCWEMCGVQMDEGSQAQRYLGGLWNRVTEGQGQGRRAQRRGSSRKRNLLWWFFYSQSHQPESIPALMIGQNLWHE